MGVNGTLKQEAPPGVSKCASPAARQVGSNERVEIAHLRPHNESQRLHIRPVIS